MIIFTRMAAFARHGPGHNGSEPRHWEILAHCLRCVLPRECHVSPKKKAVELADDRSELSPPIPASARIGFEAGSLRLL